MTKTQKGSPDSISVREYEKGETYDLPADLADVFIDQLKCCKEVEPAPEKTEEELEAEAKAAAKEAKNKK